MQLCNIKTDERCREGGDEAANRGALDWTGDGFMWTNITQAFHSLARISK